MDWTIILTGIGTIVGTALSVWALVSSTIANVEARLDARMNSLDERMFYLSTGKTIAEAMLLEQKTKDADVS